MTPAKSPIPFAHSLAALWTTATGLNFAIDIVMGAPPVGWEVLEVCVRNFIWIGGGGLLGLIGGALWYYRQP